MNNEEKKKQVEEILKKYSNEGKTPKMSKEDEIIALDRKVGKISSVWALCVGIIGALILGVGMCLTMVWKSYFALGIVIGIIGIAVVSAAFPIYKSQTAKQRKKVMPQIMKLSEEIKTNSR
ncbi:MAG: hypothetical protein ACI4W6_09300 [Acutalibacteraceae bacterium]